MTNTNTSDVFATVSQIKQLEKGGCEIVRVAVPNIEAATAISAIKQNIGIPIVADIHFDYRLAIAAIENGADKLRINPGNIGEFENVKQVVKKAKAANIPIRIGVNSGSLEKEILEKYGGVTAKGLTESAIRHVEMLEKLDFDDIVISIKSSSVLLSIEAYKLIAEKTNYPLHIGITEAGTLYSGTVKSCVGIGAILALGIGDTLRVSLTSSPVEEVKCAKEILKALELRKFGATLISCPTCGRTEIDLIKIANEVQNYCNSINKDIKIAVMGCIVNGPGEAKEADIGIAGGKGCGVIFKKGKVFKKVAEDELVNCLIHEVEEL